MRIFLIVALIVICSISAASQQSSGQTRAQEVAAAFTKFKSLSKEKNGYQKEKYKDVHSEPAIKENVAEYSGVYEVRDLGYMLTVQVGSNGQIRASGSQVDGNQSRTFTLDGAKIVGAMLTATKVYDSGAREKFEGVFLNRTDRNSPNDSGTTIFGLGVLLATPFERNGLTYDKLFYQRR